MKNNILKIAFVLVLFILPSCFESKSFNYTLYKNNVFIKEVYISKTTAFKTVLFKNNVKYYEVRVPIWFTDIYLPMDTIK